MKEYMLKNIYAWFGIVTFIGLGSCSDFLQVENPSTQIGSKSVFEDDATATSAIIGIYSEMSNSSGFASGGLSSITMLAGRSSDDFVNYSQSAAAEFATNQLTENNVYVYDYIWKEAYSYIYDVNSIIDGVSHSTNLSTPVKQQLTGEAKFLRAFFYFYLVNLFNDVPLITSTDYRTNSEAPRSSVDLIYNQIISDLLEAKALLKDDYSWSDGQKTRPNKLAVTALLARVYLYREEWDKAETESTTLINSELNLEESLDKVFLKNSEEAIWQLMPPKGTYATNEGSNFILTEVPAEVSLSPSLMQSFEDEDLRKTQWTGNVNVEGYNFEFPFKYKVKYGENELTEYSMILRLAEQYFIRAEARAQQNKLEESIDDLDAIRVRAGLPKLMNSLPGISQSEMLIAIEQERRVELFSEWGHRWLDLKRTNRAGTVLPNKADASWQPSDIFYPVPLQEIQNNKNLLPQNPGY